MSHELYRRYRPTSFDRVYGQETAVKALETFLDREKVPHAILFSGPSGTGKTTLARILAAELDCKDSNLVELNCADVRGIEGVRDIRSRMHLAPLGGSCRVWIIDEAHKLTSDAQSALLKMLEDTPDHVYFMLCTTHADKLLQTIKTRCTAIKLKQLSPTAVQEILDEVIELEDIEMDEDRFEEIVNQSDGSARMALVLLNKLVGLTDDEQQEALQDTDADTEAIDIARELVKKNTSWKAVAAILRRMKSDPEEVRWRVLNYASAILKSGKQDARCYLILCAFRDNFYDSKMAGLVAACYEVTSTK